MEFEYSVISPIANHLQPAGEGKKGGSSIKPVHPQNSHSNDFETKEKGINPKCNFSPPYKLRIYFATGSAGGKRGTTGL